MLFNSYEFILIFLPITVLIYFTLAKYKYTKLATGFLVTASLIFYAQWDITYLPLLLLSILFNYWVGTCIEKTRKKYFLWLGIGINFALLCYFKYTAFFINSWNIAFSDSFYVPEIVLPLGISFFTFTQTAYLIDAYRGETKGYSLLTYSLFVTVFPHLIAGPILYHKDMIPQFSRLRNFVFSHKNMSLGITMFSIGLFKKVVVADTLAIWVKMAFDNPASLSLIEAWAGALAYTFQLYFDFSGYSEMAIGLGFMFNLRLPVNFNSPYKATSIIDFWRRWHITLSAFLKNYLYIPLGGNRYGAMMKMRNLLITMLLGGLWHGAGWTFVIWGGLHGLYLVINHKWRSMNIVLPKVVCWGITFLSIVVAWVFFRAANIQDATMILYAMLNIENIILPAGGEAKLGVLKSVGVEFGDMMYWGGIKEIVVLIICLIAVKCCRSVPDLLVDFQPNFKWATIIAIGLAYTLVVMNGTISEFLYFQF